MFYGYIIILKDQSILYMPFPNTQYAIALKGILSS